MNRPLLSASLSNKLEREFYQRQSFSRKASSSEANGQQNANDANGNRPSDEFEQVAAEMNGVHDKGGNEKAVTATSAWSSASRDVASHHNEKRSHIKTYTWISLWFLITIPVIFWDAGYCFMRPRSMAGGDLHWIWQPYALYQTVDLVYGLPALERGDGFTNAQSLLNIVENFMNIGYLYLAHVAGSPFATLLGFASVVMTLSKTVLYWAQEYYCGGCAVGQNDWYTLIVYWVIPNGLWLVVPSFILHRLGSDIAQSLRVSSKLAAKEASGKKQ